VGGLLWALLDDDASPAEDEEPASRPPDDPRAETRRAFAQAKLKFGEVPSFSYWGSVRADASWPFGAGASVVGDVAVEGAVLLQPALAREVARDAGGRAEETLTSGTTLWTRRAASANALDGAPWTVRLRSVDDAAATLDMQVLARLIVTAGDPRGEAADPAGRRVIVVTWPARDPQLVVDVEISGHNHPQDIAPPDRGPGALRRTVPVEALEAEGVRPLELGRVPAGWRLVGAWVGSAVTPRAKCSVLTLVYLKLVYADPDAGFGDYLRLSLVSQRCGVVLDVTGARRSLTVGSFEGSVTESSSETIGALFDGTTGIRFETDLPVDDVTALLASLRPFDPDTEPEPLAATSPQ
jgi:hypothetical protein